MNYLRCPLVLSASLLGIFLVNQPSAQASDPKTPVKSLQDPLALTKERSPHTRPPSLDNVAPQPQPKQARPPEEDDEDDDDEDDDDTVQITITATRTRRPVQTVPVAIEVIDRDRLEQESIQDIRDLVRYTPGISVRNSFRYGLQDFNIRGLEGNRVLLQADGIRLPNRFQFGPFQLGRDYLDLDSISRAEIVRGPASALYGSDALGGVVSFLTPTPGELLDILGEDQYRQISLGGDSVNQGGRANLQYAGRSGNLDYSLNYTRRDNLGTRINNNSNLIDPQANTRNNILGQLVYNLNDRSQIRLLGELFDNRRDTTAAAENLPLYGIETTQSFTEDVDTQRVRGILAYRHDDPDAEGLLQGAQVRFYVQDSQIEEQNRERRLLVDRRSGESIPVQRDTENEFVDRVWGGDVQLQSNFTTGTANHQLTYGFDISSTRNERPRDRTQLNLITGERTRRIPPDTFPTKDFPDTDTFRLGVYVQDEITFGDSGWSLIPGLRYDYYSLNPADDPVFAANGSEAVDFSDDALTPSLAIGYQPNPNLFLYGRYSRGFRAPLYNEINSGFTNLTSGFFRYRTISNPDLEAETSNSFELGLRAGGDRFDVGLTGFYNSFDNFIESFALLRVEPGPENIPINVFQTQNVAEARTYGMEATAEYRFSPGSDGLSAFTRMAFTVGDNQTENVPLDTVPPFTALLGVRYQGDDDRWGLQTVTTYVGQARTDSPSPDFTFIVPDSYILVDVLGYVRFTPDLTLNVGLFNLFDEEYQVYSDVRQLNRNSSRDLQLVDRLTQPGRTISASLVWRF